MVCPNPERVLALCNAVSLVPAGGVAPGEHAFVAASQGGSHGHELVVHATMEPVMEGRREPIGRFAAATAPICRVGEGTRTVPTRNQRPQVVVSSLLVTEGPQQRTAGAGVRAAAHAAPTP